MSTPRPTPETDAFKRELCQRSKIDSTLPNDWNWIVPADFASSLERQRDEAKEQVEAMREAIKEAYDTIKDATDNCLWRSDSPIPLSTDESQRLYNRAIMTMENLQPFLP